MAAARPRSLPFGAIGGMKTHLVKRPNPRFVLHCPCAQFSTPRMRETLHGLMRGDSEKQIALVLCISRNTVHVYVTKLYRYFAVQSRVELLGRFFAIFVEEVQCRDRQEKENAAV